MWEEDLVNFGYMYSDILGKDDDWVRDLWMFEIVQQCFFNGVDGVIATLGRAMVR